MLLFRILCAILLAWAMNWAMSRPELAALEEDFESFLLWAPFVGAGVGFLNLAKRQGWGVIVAIANGIWAGAATLILTGLIVVLAKSSEAARRGTDLDFASMLRLGAESTAGLAELLFHLPPIVICLGAAAVVGLVTEIIHWALVRILHKGKKPKPTADSAHSGREAPITMRGRL